MERTWREGDALRLRLPTSLRTSRLPDERAGYNQMHALLFGPVVLACIGCARPALPGGNPYGNPNLPVTLTLNLE